MLAWWGTPRRKGLPAREKSPSAVRRRTTPWPGVYTRQCSWEISGRPSAGQPTGREEGVSSRRNNAPKPSDRLQRSSGRSTRTCVSPPVENPAFAAFEKYGDVPKTVPLDFTEDDVMWVASKLSGATGALGAEAMELCNWLLRFGCAPEEFRVVVAGLADWVANSSPPWSSYRALMACRLVALDKRPGVRPVGIGETLHRALTKLVMREAGDQAKTACDNLQMFAGLEAGIEGATHTVGKKRVERVRARRLEEEGEKDAVAVVQEEDGGERVSPPGGQMH